VPRSGKRIRVTKNVYRDSSGYEVRVVVGGHAYSARMPLDSTLAELKAKRDELADEGKAISPRATSGTLRADVPKYLKLIQHLASADDREDHLNAWIERLGDVYRYRITPADILAARVQWLTVGRPSRPRAGKRRKVPHRPAVPEKPSTTTAIRSGICIAR
jgi:hypothetical protein